MAVDLDHVRAIAERVAASLGLEVVELELRGGGKSRMLRIFIDKPIGVGQEPVAQEKDKPEGVTHEDCANLSREVSTILDVEDAVPGGSYVLEVSSPGLDRKLFRPADFERFQGSRVKLTTKDPVNGNRHFEGRLEQFEGGRLTLDLAEARRKFRPKQKAGEAPAPHKLEIELANVEKANLVPEI
ncbi:MAG TPA: ribosome maturation factor RimP [Terriglobales bacterium]|nr:ribosome maturation factor RimP [Terriglobales bacterium]